MNVTALVNASGAVVERYAYDPYGKVTILDGTTGGQTEWAADDDQKSDVDNEILYCGYRFDPEPGLYHVRHRYYHPTLGRWSQPDEDFYDDLNLHQYGRSNPVNLTDTGGLAAAPAGASGGRAPENTRAVCCCIGDPDNCYIDIQLTWAVAPHAEWTSITVPTGNKAPTWNYGRPAPPRFTQVRRLSFGARPHARVTLRHKKDADVTGCHLRQDVDAQGNWNLNATFVTDKVRLQTRGRTLTLTHPWSVREPYIDVSIAGDYNSQFSSLPPSTIDTYHAWWYEDAPFVGGNRQTEASVRGLPNPAMYWFQAHVVVEENNKVENWWGFQASFSGLQQAQPSANGEYWKDTKRDKPNYGRTE